MLPLVVIPRTQYTFHGSTVGGVATAIPLLIRVDSSAWVTSVLLVRLHAKTFPSATSSAVVDVLNEAYTPDDPAIAFLSDIARASATIPNGATAPKLYLTSLAQPIGAMVRVVLRFYQGATNAGLSKLTLSAALIGRRF